VPLESPEYVESKPTPEITAGEEAEPEQVEAETSTDVLPTTMLLKAIDSRTKKRIDVNLTVFRTSDKKTVQIKKMDIGLYKLEFSNSEPEDYTFIAKKPGYMFKNMEITVPAASPSRGKELDKYIELDRLEVGYQTVLRNIYFDFNKATLKPESYRELNNLKKIMDQNPWYKVEIAGHTDAIGSAQFNMELSQKRAQAVVNYLVKQGINPGRLIAKGYGETQPLASNDDELEGRELNRRVEFKIIKSSGQ
jgi:outer membrane protein OmpA-like peptidoglycan-associated protein